MLTFGSLLLTTGDATMDHSKAIVISDLSVCQPQTAVTPGHLKYHWQATPYEAEGVSGTLLFAGPETEAPPLTLPLEVSGWHAIFVGLWSNWTPSLLKIKLTSDPAYVTMNREEAPNGRVDNFTTDERFFKYADLTGEEIMLAQQGGGAPTPAYITYVKLVPLSDAEVAAIKAERAGSETKRLFFMNDGFSNFGTLRPTTVEDIWQWLEPYRDTDFKTLLWCPGAGGDVLNYISEYGGLIGDSTTDYPRVSDRQNAESHQILAGKGIDPMKTVIDYCHTMGVQVHVSNRMEAFQCSPPFEEFFTGRFYTEHPEWRCVDIDGREIARMSYAYEGVRDLMLNMFKEATDKYDADGVNPIFNRGAPFMLYEQPLLDGFEAETGLDARQLAEDDERYLRYRAGVMTDFMRTLRRELDAIGEKKGRKLEVSAHVLSNEETNLFFGLDVPTWIEEGLIDNLISYPWRDVEPDVAYFGSLTKGTPVKFYPEVMPRRMPPEEYRLRGIENYAAGADGMCFWDTNGRDQMRKEWSMLRRLGHKDDLAGWDDGEGKFWRSRKMISVGGYVLDKYPPHWAF